MPPRCACMSCVFPVMSLRIEAEDACCVGIGCAAHSLQLLLKDLEGKPLVKGANGTSVGEA